MNDRILIGHGSGGSMMQELIQDIFLPAFRNPVLLEQGDSAILAVPPGELAFTTDSYVVDPLFFPGGDIGKLAVCGTLNDLAVAGARPLFLSVGFILEEGLEIAVLKEVVTSMAAEAREAGVTIVTGDTKVVGKGKADKLFINTAGIGYLPPAHRHISGSSQIQPGDKLLINGTLGDHSVAVLAAREQLGLRSPVVSDCANLAPLIQSVWPFCAAIHAMRDLTRGGLATAGCELFRNKGVGLDLWENQIPVQPAVLSFCELLGFDPLNLANEGKVLMLVAAEQAGDILEILQTHPLGRKAAIIGEVTTSHSAELVLHTIIGGKRRLLPMAGEQLPRIC